MSAQPKNESKDGSDLGRAGQEQLQGTIAPPQVGSGFNVDPSVLNGIRNDLVHTQRQLTTILGLPVPGTEIVAAFNYGMSLWGRTAKLICRLPTGERINYFLKVGKLIQPIA